MKTWRVIATDDNGSGTGTEWQDRWAAEEAFEAAKGPGKLVTLAEFHDGAMREVVRDSRLERAVGVYFHAREKETGS